MAVSEFMCIFTYHRGYIHIVTNAMVPDLGYPSGAFYIPSREYTYTSKAMTPYLPLSETRFHQARLRFRE